MSFILDALKKSEAERQRQTTPGLMDVSPIAPRPKFPLWTIAIGVLLGVNLIVLIVVLMRREPAVVEAGRLAPVGAAAPASAASSVGAAAPASAAAPMGAAAQGTARNANNFSPLDPPVYAPEIPVPQNTPAPAPSTAGAVPGDGIARASPKPAAQFEPRLARAPAARENEEMLPTLDEMKLSGQRAIPEMHLDIHVYDANPSNRFVFVNMRKYREGAALQEGPMVERITREGVILSYQGLRFVLPRQ